LSRLSQRLERASEEQEGMSKITDELQYLNLETAVAFFALTLHREEGRTVPTATVIAEELSPEACRRITNALLDAATAELRALEQQRGS
jgi:hypothetical protein